MKKNTFAVISHGVFAGYDFKNEANAALKVDEPVTFSASNGDTLSLCRATDEVPKIFLQILEQEKGSKNQVYVHDKETGFGTSISQWLDQRSGTFSPPVCIRNFSIDAWVPPELEWQQFGGKSRAQGALDARRGDLARILYQAIKYGTSDPTSNRDGIISVIRKILHATVIYKDI